MRRTRIAIRSLRLTLLRLLLAALLAIAAPSGATADPQIPNFWDLKERFPKPQLGNLQRLRFLTTVDFPPFNFIDANGDLTGFHVDLVRRICAELEVTPVCQIQAVPWNELESTLANGGGEAIVAGLAITATREALVAMADPDERPDRAVLVLGYAGWGDGQLAAEVEEGSWYVLPSEPADLFADTPERLWARVLRRQPGELAWVSTAPLDPTMN